MIQVFRHIRKKLINQKQMKKYTVYAIGEIFLVVIGILIALQINNWNEERKNKAFEEEMLMQLRANLIKDKITLIDIESNFKKAIQSSDKILTFNWQSSNRDSLKFWLSDIIQFERFEPLTNTYELLKSKGLDLVSNKQLRFLIGSYYDDTTAQTIKSIRDVEISFNNDWLPMMKTEVVDFKFQQYVIVRDFEIFKEQGPSKNVLIMNRDNYGGGIDRIQLAKKSIDQIQKIINSELN